MHSCLRFILLGAVLAAFCDAAVAADYKPERIDRRYDHDRFGIEPADHIRKFRAFISSFDSDDDDNGDGVADYYAIPEWVAYELRRYPGKLPRAPKRPDRWITDEELHDLGWAPADESYRYSNSFRQKNRNWYVRGHLCMKQHAWRLGEAADWNTHTFLNAVPQRDEFNSNIWQDLEDRTAGWADRYGRIWIVTGPIFYAGEPAEYIGEDGEIPVAVPDALFKIVSRKPRGQDAPEVLAFIYEQSGPGYRRSPFDHESHLVSVDEIEDYTGLDFFADMDTDIQDQIESVVANTLWD